MDTVRLTQVAQQLRSGAALARQLGRTDRAADATLLDDFAAQIEQALLPNGPGTEFALELETLINRHSLEQHSDTPDFILAQFLNAALTAFQASVRARETWYGRDPRCGNYVPLKQPGSSAE